MTDTNSPPDVQWRCTACLAVNESSRPDETAAWVCSGCGRGTPAHPEALDAEGRIAACPVCGCRDIYRQRDFNRKLGLAIIIAGAVGAALIPNPFLKLASLVACALVDLAIYMMIPDVVGCYHCQAVCRGYQGTAEVGPYDLNISDKYLDIERRRGW